MSYVVRQGSELTAAFKSLIGVLTGDTASPILWNIYFADLAGVFGPDRDDVCLNGRPVSHLEQADDVALFSTTVAGLQRKLDLFFGWCRVNFSATKTEWMIFGELPLIIPRMMVGIKPIKLVKEYKFVGVIFTSVTADIFSAHYSKKASKGRAVANTTFAAKSMIGCLPVYEGIRLYMARIDPHLTFGCEVCIDVVAGHLEKLTHVQHEYIRRLLGVHSHSILAILSTETGVIPLTYRRAILALGYLIYLITLPPNHFATAAYLDSLLLARDSHPCWISDLRFVLMSLPVPINLPDGELTAANISDVRKATSTACEKSLGDALEEMASRLPLIQGRLERDEDGKFVKTALKLCLYLRVPVPAHRKALTRLLLSSHTLGIEILRYQERYDRKRAPREWRLCRFCLGAVESESHALMACTEMSLVTLRADLLRDVYQQMPDFPRVWDTSLDLLLALIRCRNFEVIQRLAKYTFDIFAVYATREIYRPAEYLYDAAQ
ncbi:hypothetical protein B0H11DRAFT_1754302 [Mycena galericulata]|nr:hypothetical protein B0H11DRAFT_1754302 [Mycena galericulata]